MKPHLIEENEIELLLEAIYRRYGYDFKSYARKTINRRIKQFIQLEQMESVADLITPVLKDETFAFKLIQRFSITVSEMFRDPFVYRSLKKHVLPLLRTYPSFKIWHAGCADGEEVYSLAILLKEEGILDRATIYATDFNHDALAAGKKGIYQIDDIDQVCKNYLEAGGQGKFSDYYYSAYGAVSMSSDLKQNITFASHNLVQDESFGEVHLILCRNVLIYFDQSLQKRALKLFSDSLINGGFLCLGAQEDMIRHHKYKYFKTIDSTSRIFQKRPGS